MDISEKRLLFNKFLIDWGDKFQKVPSILKYLAHYPEITNRIEDFSPMDIDELNASQLEWIALIAQFDHPIDKSFYKEYWVPIPKNSFTYFIDLSTESFQLFATPYFFFKPYRWHKKFIYKDLSEFLINLDKPRFSVDNHFEQLENEWWSEVTEFFKDVDKLKSRRS